MNGPRKRLVLVVDDEFLIAQGLCLQVEDLDMAVCGTAATADEAVALAQLHKPELVLMDVRLRGDKDGVDAALAIHHAVGSKVIFITGSREPSTIARIQMDHPAGVLFKPISDRQLRSAVEVALGG
ncbi:histidine kinase [Caulobacter sp. Root655]|uniref:response regulator n=1 Tax=Caulobacter sp. Root655 TaxID=1736578 RepID=UPI000702076C|nr:response regulator [Caulobacter sp. Root655]KRA61538.1 histidine kinase [Caulobacter sp. Root655]